MGGRGNGAAGAVEPYLGAEYMEGLRNLAKSLGFEKIRVV